MKTRKHKKGGDLKLFGYTLKKTQPSVSKLKKMLLEVGGEKYINIDPIVKDWADFDPKLKKWILKEKYKSTFIEAFAETVVVVAPPFNSIDTLSNEVSLIKAEHMKEIQVVLGSIKERLLKIKLLPLSLKQFIEKWINYTRTYVNVYELSEISNILVTKEINPINTMINFPVPPLIKGGNGDKEQASTSGSPPDIFAIEFILKMLECICHLLLMILAGQ